MQYPFGSWGILIEIWMQGILSLRPSSPCTNAWTDSNWEYGNYRITLVGHHPCPKVTQANFRKESVPPVIAILFCLINYKKHKWNHRIHFYKITRFCGIVFILVFRTLYFFEMVTPQHEEWSTWLSYISLKTQPKGSQGAAEWDFSEGRER